MSKAIKIPVILCNRDDAGLPPMGQRIMQFKDDSEPSTRYMAWLKWIKPAEYDRQVAVINERCMRE